MNWHKEKLVETVRVLKERENNENLKRSERRLLRNFRVRIEARLCRFDAAHGPPDSEAEEREADLFHRAYGARDGWVEPEPMAQMNWKEIGRMADKFIFENRCRVIHRMCAPQRKDDDGSRR